MGAALAPFGLADIIARHLGHEIFARGKNLGLKTRLARALDSDLLYNFRRSPIAVIAAAATFLMVFCAVAAPFISPQNPWDPAVLELVNSLNPPAWMDGGSRAFFLGTDDQGRDLLSAIFYGLRISLLVGSISTLIAMAIGIAAGLLCGYREGLLDAFVMRIADAVAK